MQFDSTEDEYYCKTCSYVVTMDESKLAKNQQQLEVFIDAANREIDEMAKKTA